MLVDEIRDLGVDPCDFEGLRTVLSLLPFHGCARTRRFAALIEQCEPGARPRSEILPPGTVVRPRFSPDLPYCLQVLIAIDELLLHPSPTVRGLVPDPAHPGRLVVGVVPAPPGVTLPLAGFTQSVLRRLADRCPAVGPSFCFDLFGTLVTAITAARARGILIPDDLHDDLFRCFEKHETFKQTLPEFCPIPAETV